MKKIIFFLFFLNVCLFESMAVTPKGYVSIEMESTTSPLGQWQKIGQGVPYSIPTASGGEHLEFTGNAPAGGGANSPLEYPFTVDVTGKYRFVIRSSRRAEGTAGDLCNDSYIKFGGNFTSANSQGWTVEQLKGNIKFWGAVATPAQGWSLKYDINHVQPAAEMYLIAGEPYTMTMSGRSQRYSPDFWVLYNVDMYTEAQVTATKQFYPGGTGPIVIPPDFKCWKKTFLDRWDLSKPAGYLASSILDISKSAFQINTSFQPVNEWAAAQIKFTGSPGIQNVILTSLQEVGGECSYRVLVNGIKVLEFQNQRIFGTTVAEYTPYTVGIRNVNIPKDAMIQVDFKSNSNQLKVEGTGFATARARWSALSIGECAAVTVDKWLQL